MALERKDKDNLTLVQIDATREAVEKYFNDFKAEDYTETNTDVFNSVELDELLGQIRQEFKSTLNIVESEFVHHLAFLLLRAARVSTSSKVKYTGSYKYKLRGREYTVNDHWVFPMIGRITKKFQKPNGLRAFCSTLEDAYLTIAKLMPDLFHNPTVGRKGLPSGKEFLGADFLSGASKLLDEYDRAVVIASANNAISRSMFQNSDKQIVSLYDYGK